MKTAIAILSMILLLSVITIAWSDTCDSEDCTPVPVFIEENETGRLYRIDLKNGPLHYYEIDTEYGTIIKVVAIATMHMNVTAVL